MLKRYLTTIMLTISVIAVLLLIGCSGSNVVNTFDSLLKTDNSTLEKESVTREDKYAYGEATGSMYFSIYFPLVLPTDFKYSSHSIDDSDFDGGLGRLTVKYTHKSDQASFVTVYEGSGDFTESDIDEKHKIGIGDNKPIGTFQKTSDGTLYISWFGDDDDWANEEVVYVIAAKGVDKDVLVSMAKKMVVYE